MKTNPRVQLERISDLATLLYNEYVPAVDKQIANLMWCHAFVLFAYLDCVNPDDIAARYIIENIGESALTAIPKQHRGNLHKDDCHNVIVDYVTNLFEASGEISDGEFDLRICAAIFKRYFDINDAIVVTSVAIILGEFLTTVTST